MGGAIIAIAIIFYGLSTLAMDENIIDEVNLIWASIGTGVGGAGVTAFVAGLMQYYSSSHEILKPSEVQNGEFTGRRLVETETSFWYLASLISVVAFASAVYYIL